MYCRTRFAWQYQTGFESRHAMHIFVFFVTKGWTQRKINWEIPILGKCVKNKFPEAAI